MGYPGRGLVAVVLWAAAAGAGAEIRDVDGFDRVVFALPGKLTLQRADDHTLEIEASAEDLEHIQTRVRGGQLSIQWREGARGWFGGRPEGPITVRVGLPELHGLEVAGSGNVEGGTWLSETLEVEVNGSGSARFDEVAAEELSLEISGSGSIEVAAVDAALVKVEISGSGDVELAGTADRQEIEVMGSGDVVASELEGARVTVEIMGSGDVSVWATESLTAEVMGSGDVRYRGEPRVDVDEHGPGRVRAL